MTRTSINNLSKCNAPELRGSVSVVIPVYNRAQTIVEAIASVLAQTCQPLEIIVVDDCSTDDTVEAVERLSLPNILIFTLARNSGGGVARNRGVAEARGDLIAFLDSDDLWEPTKLQIQVGRWIQLGRPDDYFSYTAVAITKEEQFISVNPRLGYSYGETLSTYLFCKKNSIQTSSYVISTKLARENPFSTLRKHQDWDLLFKLYAQQIKFNFVPEPLTQWRQGGNANRVSSIPNYKLSLQWHASVPEKIDGRMACRLCFYGCAVFPAVFSTRNFQTVVRFLIFYIGRENLTGVCFLGEKVAKFMIRKIKMRASSKV